jgi:ribosomal protein L40E
MTVAVCLKCGAMKHGAWTPCRKCGHTPENLEDKAKHVMTSDRYFSQADLEDISTRVQNGQPLHFDPKQVEEYVASLKTTKTDGKRIGLFVFSFFAVIVVVIVGAIYLFTIVSR